MAARPARPARDAFVRYEWPCPGDLLHMDVKRYPRFYRPGPEFGGGPRHRTTADVHARPGWEYFHAIVDDHSRLAYGELLDDERAPTVTAFTERALVWFAGHDITVKRVMTDGAFSYQNNRSPHRLLTEHGIHHIITPPYTPRWNGKGERFHQTMNREWARGQRYRNSTARNHALPHWLEHYNHGPTPQRTRRPTTHQPRLQPLKARQKGRTGASRHPGRRRAGGDAVVTPIRCVSAPACVRRGHGAETHPS